MQSKLIWLGVLGLISAASCFAAENGRGDAFGSVGVYHGFSRSDLMVGGGGSILLAGGKLAAFGEFEYVPLGTNGDTSARQLLVGGGLRVYVPFTAHFWLGKTLNHVKPFVPVGGGYGRRTAHRVSVPVSFTPFNSWYVETGIGFEIGSKRFGVRPEFRYIRMQYVGLNPSHGTNNTTIGASFYFGF